MRSAGIGVSSPIGIDPTPEEVGAFRAATKENTFSICTAKVSKHMFSGCHVQFARKLDIFAELGIRKRKIRPGHINEVA